MNTRSALTAAVLSACLLLCVYTEDYSDEYTHEPGKCILQNSCGSSLPCAHNTVDPIVPDDEHLQLLKTACPMYADKENVCCDKDQLQDFIKQLDVVKNIIGGCDACYWDFQAIECAFFCDPNHAQFIQITNSTLNATDSRTTVSGIRYFITKDAARRIYDACKNVRDSISGGIGIVYVCGSADCDQKTFYVKLGDNAYTDLKVEFIVQDTSSVEYVKPKTDEDVFDCSDTVNNKTCDCYNCEQITCPVFVDKNTIKTWHYTLPVGLALCLVWIILVVVLTFLHKTKTTTKIKQVAATGLDNKGAELTSPVPTHQNGNAEYGTSISPELSRPNDVPLSPNLSVASTASPLPTTDDGISEMPNHHGENGACIEEVEVMLVNGNSNEYENRSLVKKKQEPAYQCWLRLGPRLGDCWSNLVFDYWYIVLVVCFILAGVCCGGWYNFRITTDPVELWTSKDSISRMQKIDFDSQFGTTYRTCQMVIKERSPSTFGVNNKVVNGIFNPDIMKQTYDMMVAIESLKVGEVSYSDLCYKPLGEFNKTNPREDCATLSVFQWMDNDRNILDNPTEYIKRMELCAEATALPECLASFRGPSATNIVLGGYDAKDLDYMDSTLLAVTFALDGSDTKLDNILKWETAMKEYLLEETGRRTDLKITFSTDRALEDEINRASHADIFTIVLSYILMFVYVGITLGDIDCSFKGCLLNSKALLGVGGVVIVLVSVVSALGATSYAGLPTTLIVVEVIPFLILAVGVDNVYIMVQGIQRIISEKIERDETLNSTAIRGILSSMMRDVFPAMILSSLCQMVAFALGSLSFMPSVQNFAYNATIALLMNFILQSTVFLILIRLDLKRQLSGRLDVLCCVKTELSQADRGPTRWFIEEYWSKYLLYNKWIPAFILIFFGCFTIANVMLIPDLKLGLEPTMALPSDSYLLDYYHIAYNDYRIGPGMSFVFKSKDGSPLDVYEDKTYGELISNTDSLLRTINKYGDSVDFQYITGKGSSFMQVFSENWLESDPCCWNKGTSSVRR
ncbi:NPC intracellular cholesterol transporter 1-like isoform X4 [Bolinopsis microptera]|uniref:NPC intracellular cholesterol transporter 1-like isoform X4 n=1 Tax=Bolinopsis microptera TaxID=2820187 RepID=UPI003078EBAF